METSANLAYADKQAEIRDFILELDEEALVILMREVYLITRTNS